MKATDARKWQPAGPALIKEKMMNKHLSKMVSILAVVSLLSAGSTLAQNQRGDTEVWQKGPPTAEEKLAQISAALNLSGNQSQEMLRLLQEQGEQGAALHEQTMMLMGPEICAQRAENEEAILAILDAEQTELFLQTKEQRKQANTKRKGRRGNGMGELDCAN
jgi:hypothetical protein